MHWILQVTNKHSTLFGLISLNWLKWDISHSFLLFVCPPHKFQNGGRWSEVCFLFFTLNTVLTNGFSNGGWKIYQVRGPHTVISYTKRMNQGIVSAIVHITEIELTPIIKFWQLKTASFVTKFKNQKCFGVGKKIQCRGGWRANKHFFMP